MRDMPIDYTLLVENVADPDHGVFAHQTPIFDSFAASSEHKMDVTTEPGRAGDKVGSLFRGSKGGRCCIGARGWGVLHIAASSMTKISC